MHAYLREATPDDLDTIAAVTRSHRHRLAAWGPQWWRMAEGADDLHPLWLEHLITSDLATVRVIVSGDDVLGSAIAMPQPEQWFIDDIAVVDESMWPDAARVLAREIPERPALTCLATADTTRAAAFGAEGIALVSSYWIRATESGTTTDAGLEGSPPRQAPPHSFGPGFDPTAPGALAFSIDAGTVIGSPPTMPPPVYDAEGPVTLVDRMYGDDLDALARTALANASARGDVLLAVVCAADNDALQATLAAHGFQRTVDVRKWPTSVA